ASKRNAGLAMTVGLDRSSVPTGMPLSSSMSVPLIRRSAPPDLRAQTEPSAFAAQCLEPRQRIPPGRAAVEGERRELRASADVGDRHRSAEPVAAEPAVLGPAVGRMVAVVAHQEHVSL